MRIEERASKTWNWHGRGKAGEDKAGENKAGEGKRGEGKGREKGEEMG